MKKLGVIDGLGPMATAFFMQMVIEMTDAETDQDHIEMLIYSKPSTPDRTKFILGESDKNPAPVLKEVGQTLVECGADVIAIPCVTANYFLDELETAISVPIIDIVKETAHYLKVHGVKTAGIMATDGTIQSGLFQKELTREGVRAVVPDEEGQRDVMHLIYENVKATKPIEMDCFARASQSLREAGAEVIVLGCTELSMIRRDEQVGADYLDAMQVLAKCSVEQCAALKKEYEEIITK